MKTNYIKAKPLYYSPVLDSTSTTKRDSYTERFDSTSEYTFFKLLQTTLPKKYILERQVKVDVLECGQWTLDFKLTSTLTTQEDKLKKLLTVCGCSTGLRDKVDHIYIEYKGVQDNHFKTKMTAAIKNDEWLTDRLILVSNECDCFIIENLTYLEHYTKVIVSKNYLMHAIRESLYL
jgi:hypothetical protein